MDTSHWARNEKNGHWTMWHYFTNSQTPRSACEKYMLDCHDLSPCVPYRRGPVCLDCLRHYEGAQSNAAILAEQGERA